MSLRKTICYLVAHGFTARMLLHSRLAQKIGEAGYRLVILVSDQSKESLGHVDPQLAELHSVRFQKTRLLMSLSDARRYLKEPIRKNAALWSRHQYWAHGQGGTLAKYRAKFNYAAHRMLYRCKPFHALFNVVDHWAHRSSQVRTKLQEINPDVLVSTYPVTPFEVSSLLEAKSLGIPTVGHLLSWDNITCKGFFSVVPSRFITWGPIMDRELAEYYSVDDANKYACGVPHFDAHRELVDVQQNKKNLLELGLDSEKPYLFFGMSAPIFAPQEIDLVEWMANQIRSDAFGAETQLVVRPHPQNVTGNMADPRWLPRLKAIQGDRVGVNLPRLASQGLSWNMESSDLSVLVNLLAGCSVCFNSGSTLSIDALLHRKPVIVTLFDAAGNDLPWWQSARRIREYPHYKKLLDLGGVVAVGNCDELLTETNAFLRSPERLMDERLRTVAEQCTSDSGSCDRVVAAFESILSDRS